MTNSENHISPVMLIGAIIVVSIVAVALWPHSLVNPIRQPLTKVNGELRTIAIAVFDADSARKTIGTKPFVSNEFVFGPVDEVFPGLDGVLDPLQIEDLLKDDYHPSDELYRAAGWKETFVLISVGPDGVLNVTEKQVKDAIEKGTLSDSARLLWSYSPTNGLESSGDVFRVQY